MVVAIAPAAFVPPMLAHDYEKWIKRGKPDLMADPQWAAQVKWDGCLIEALINRDGKLLGLCSREGRRWNECPALNFLYRWEWSGSALHSFVDPESKGLPDDDEAVSILVGEITAEGGTSSDVTHLLTNNDPQNKLRYQVFDCVQANGLDLTSWASISAELRHWLGL